MFDKDTDFPQYRKLSNDKVFYRIVDERNFDEIQIIGTKAQLRHVKAEKYPEMLRIQDMLSFGIEGFILSDEAEFSSLNEKFTFI